MRQARVLYKDELAGHLIQHDDGSFTFRYTDEWLLDSDTPPISLTLQKITGDYRSKALFPFFYNMLPEGSNRDIVCRHFRIEKKDYFGILLKTARYDTIGAVRVEQIWDNESS